jgi:iron complex transport system permease protein
VSYRPHDLWLIAGGRLSILVDKRATIVFVALALLILASVGVSLTLGSSPLSLREIEGAIRGVGDEAVRMILFEIRLPRMVATLVAGFALGLAGCISQTVFGNRLAAPDVLGINEGATLAIVAFVTCAAGGAWPFWIAPLGSLLAVGILYKVCAARREHGAVLLIGGICVTEFLRSIVELLMSLGALHEVQNIYVWLQGSFIGQGYDTALPVLALLGLFLPLLLWLSRYLELLRLPASIVQSLGVDVALVERLCVGAVAVLAALGASIGGPVAFVAMASPVLISSLVRGRTPALWCSGLLGAGILLLSDTIARSIAPQEIAAGIVTRILGGCFLLYLLVKDGVR